MNTKKISAVDAVGALRSSILIGKKHYLVLVSAAIIFKAINIVLNATSAGMVLNSFIGILWLPGYIHVAQKIVQNAAVPQLKDFFIVFDKQAVLKRMVPSMILELILSLIIVGFIGGVMTLLYKLVLSGAFDMTGYPVWLVSIIPLVSLVIFPLPFQFYTYVLLLQKANWKESLKLTLSGFFKNCILLLFLQLLTVVPIAIFLILHQLIRAPEIESKVIEMLGAAMTVSITPFLMTLHYFLYKKIFAPDQAEIMLSDYEK